MSTISVNLKIKDQSENQQAFFFNPKAILEVLIQAET